MTKPLMKRKTSSDHNPCLHAKDEKSPASLGEQISMADWPEQLLSRVFPVIAERFSGREFGAKCCLIYLQFWRLKLMKKNILQI